MERFSPDVTTAAQLSPMHAALPSPDRTQEFIGLRACPDAASAAQFSPMHAALPSLDMADDFSCLRLGPDAAVSGVAAFVRKAATF